MSRERIEAFGRDAQRLGAEHESRAVGLAQPWQRGYHVPYRGSETPCPGCGRSNWYVGRMSAECAFCSTAVARAEAA